MVNGERPDGGSENQTAVREDTGTVDFFIPADASVKMMEQNAAFLSIEQAFSDFPHRPDKKSLKQDSDGKYLETAFISPMIGRRYRDVLQSLADETGWRLHISDKINQNDLLKTAQMLCMEHGVRLIKNPSYIPENLQVFVTDIFE